jgi:predicted transport protein
MGDIKLFGLHEGVAAEITGSTVAHEKSLQKLMEANLGPMLGIRLLASEYGTGKAHAGRIDSLGIDEDGSPVIVEYKRWTNENVINQGLFYLDWLLDHKAEFQLLVMKELGADAAENIHWAGTRLLCIAADFTRYDDHAVRQIGRNIELIRYRRFGDELLLLELATSVSGSAPGVSAGTSAKPTGTSEPAPQLESSAVAGAYVGQRGPLCDLLEHVRTWLLALGEDVQEKQLKHYLAYKRIRNFASVEIKTGKQCLLIFVKADFSTFVEEPGFTKDMREVGHLGTGDVGITVASEQDFERAHPLIRASYEAN